MSRLVLLLAIGVLARADEARDRWVTAQAQALRPRLVETRRDFHMHPELSNREERTSRVIAEKLRALGLDAVKTGVARHGVVALLKGAKPGPVVAVRADMDALPIQETIDAPYKSRNDGVKHACGHDLHMTVQLGVAELLARRRAELRGAVKFLFQPAEEGPPEGEEGGAGLMVKEGALDDPRPAAIFALHSDPSREAGTVGYTPGGAMASADRFVARIRGKKVHAAWPHEGIDAAVLAAEAVLALQSIRSRRIDPSEPMVLTIGSIHGGNRFNIVADEVLLEGTVRALNEDVRGKVRQLMHEILAGVTSAHGGAFELKFTLGYPVTYNDPALVERTLPTMRRVLGDNNVAWTRASMGAEDFSLYQKVIPGFLYWLGVGNRARGITAAVHTPEFDIDEDALAWIPTGGRELTDGGPDAACAPAGVGPALPHSVSDSTKS
jgi:amidohydrolase